VQELWDRIADDAAELPLTEEQKRLLDERIEAHERDPSAARPWEEVRKEVLAKLGR
jgi:putative addiction module component (TIGR02574 family)